MFEVHGTISMFNVGNYCGPYSDKKHKGPWLGQRHRVLGGPGVAMVLVIVTQRLQCSSFSAMTYFLLRDYNILLKKELHLSLWV